jgi:ribosomal protein S27AE
MFKIKAFVHSLSDKDEVLILHEDGFNDVVAEYKGKRCTAIFNPFVCLYYVDDIYGELRDRNKCPVCGEFIAEHTVEERDAAEVAEQTGGRPKVNAESLKKAVRLYISGQYSVREIEKMTGIRKSALYRGLRSTSTGEVIP